MKALKFLVAAVLFVVAFPAHAQEPLFSNYGYKNLSAASGVGSDVEMRRVETALDGSTLHLLWADEEVDGVGRLWYRRSNDLGLTWEAPVDLYALAGVKQQGNPDTRMWKYMSVSGGKVHIVARDAEGLVCLTSTDGKSFQKKQVAATTNSVRAAFMQAVGNKVAVCYQTFPRETGFHVAYSTDGGETFADSLVTCRYEGGTYDADLQSFAFDGEKMAAMAIWNDRWLDNRMVWTVTSAEGEPFTTTQIATELTTSDGKVYRKGDTVAGDYSACEPLSCLAIEGSSIYALIQEQLTADDGTYYLALHRSTDGGKTWLPAQQICTEQYKPKSNPHAYLKVRGNDVYILTETGGYGQYEIRNLIFHSHDGGETFACQTDWTETIHKRGHISDYTLCFAPTDPTGRTIWLAGNDYSWVKTTDGFQTIDEVSCNDSHCPDGVGFWNNLYTNLEIDGNGTPHWFIRYRSNGAERHEIVYRREVAESAPGHSDKVLAVAPYTDKDFAKNRVVIPNNRNFHGTALTMEMWARIDKADNGSTMAYLSHDSNQDDLYCTGLGWSKDYWSEDRFFAAQLINEKDDRLTLTCKSAALTMGKWYHLALTYDEATHKARFFVNGVLAEEQDFYGAIGWGWNPIVLGNPDGWGSKYAAFAIDNFRLWNRALPEEEIRANLYKNIEKAEGLKINLGFDDTLLDLSGNGNDGYGMADVDFADSDIRVPVADFDICTTETGDVVLSNHSTDCDTFLWTFGDGTSSTLAQPTHRYNKPGEYQVSLQACNATTYASAAKSVTVAGLSDIQPRRIGNTGKILATITGGAISAKQTPMLTRDGQTIKASQVWEERPGILKAWFEVEEAELGRWTLQVGDATLADAVTIEETREEKPWMEFRGRGKILYNKWLTHTLSYGNKGNVDAYNVPLNFFISHYPDLEVELIDFDFKLPNLTEEVVPPEMFDEVRETLKQDIGDYVIVKDEDGKEWRYYPFQVPIIKAGSSHDVHIRLKTSKDIQIKYWADQGWGDFSDEAEDMAAKRMARGEVKAKAGGAAKRAQAECLLSNIGMGVIDAVIDIIPFGGCAWGTLKTVYGACTDDANDRWGNLAMNLGMTGLSCATAGLSSIGKIGYIAATSIGMGSSMAGAVLGGKSCMGGPKNSSNIPTASAWDPNEMIGPSQYMDADSVHWIAPSRNMPYTILFENKKEATAPAHTVFVTDTLDLAKMDLDDFAFTTVGWGDTLVSVPGEQRSEFALDIDMRPAKPYIVRTTGKLDKETGVVNWMFITLNPETLDEEEDPDLGFLPPNDDSHRGEGFVSFIVGQKAGLATRTQIANKASIVFDGNAPIVTNTFVNAIDTDLPSSAAYLVSNYDENHLLVQWSGSDESSGVAWYNVYMSTDNQNFKPVKEMFDGESTLVEKQPDTYYYFYTIVTDHVGLSETEKCACDVMYDPVVGIEAVKGDFMLNHSGDRNYEVILPSEVKEATMKVYGIDGRELQSQRLGGGHRFNVALQAPGAHIFVINADGQRYVWKIAQQ
ncbi:MAG: PKD domain-containing protein [Bacteroidales bacterium]|nr:PKD domain-containing protein [Candidatus Equimonas faecalis]